MEPKLRIDCYGNFTTICLEGKVLGVGVKSVKFEACGSGENGESTLKLELDMKAFSSSDRPAEKN